MRELTESERKELILRQLEDRAVKAKTLDDLSAVVVDLLRRLRRENQQG